MLKINQLKVKIEDKEILHDVTLVVKEGQVAALMGQNGSGKSTLAQTIMGHPAYSVVGGSIIFNDKELNDLAPTERSLSGVFLSFQYPSEVTGVTISSYLRMIHNKAHNTNVPPALFRKALKEKMELLEINEDFASRYLNEGFSGGEKKRMEMLQMLVLEPKIAILDETDSGLDVDALRVVSKAINYLKEKTNMSVLLITHYTRIFKYIEPDIVFVMQNGSIIKEGDKSLAHLIEEKGYANV